MVDAGLSSGDHNDDHDDDHAKGGKKQDTGQEYVGNHCCCTLPH